MDISEKQRIAVSVAKKYIGEREIPNNQGFVDAEYQKRIEACGWLVGQAWCSYAGELIWKEAYPELFDVLDKLFDASAVKTCYNFRKSDLFVCNHNPLPGCLVIWQTYRYGVPYWTGHLGIYDHSLPSNNFYSIEGNTNASGGREGIENATKLRPLKFEPTGVKEELVIMDFVKLKGEIPSNQ
jgi:hypothetical protein